MIKKLRYKIADVILPNDHVIIKNFYKPAPLYIEFTKGKDYDVYSSNSQAPKETSGEQLQTPF